MAEARKPPVGDTDVAGWERLRALLDAVVGISTSLDPRGALRLIVTAACELLDARYGAIGVVGRAHRSGAASPAEWSAATGPGTAEQVRRVGAGGPERLLTEFITHGIDADVHAAIGDLPHGRGVLGLLVADPHPVRMPDVTAHPRSYGFPRNHPPMSSFLGVPLRVRDQIFGTLYLAEKRGAREFTQDDEEIAVALAAAAGVAIENARLYALAQRRQRWLAATAEITGVLLGDEHLCDALPLVARRVREVAGADLVLLLVYDGEAGRFTVEVVEAAPGRVPELVGAVLPAAGTMFAEAVTAGRHAVVESLAEAAPWPVPVTRGPALISPLAAGATLHGVLVVGQPAGEDALPDEDIPLLASFAGQAALAMERARAQEERELLVVLEDRERIARDLHDVVIQRLFATGLHLQSTVPLAARPEVTQRINTAVDDLDVTIRDIRRAIFELRTPVTAALRTEILEVVGAVEPALGFRPALEMSGPVDSGVPDEVRPDLLAVLQESLSNVVRHAAAGRVTVGVHVAAGQVTVSVQDDGVGADPAAARGGLVNLRDRAERYGGGFSVDRVEPHGTLVRWSVPLR